MDKKYGAARVSEGDMPMTSTLDDVVRDDAGVLRASSFTADVCPDCGAMRLLFCDKNGRAYAWIGISSRMARGISAMLEDLADAADAITPAGSPHKH